MVVELGSRKKVSESAENGKMREEDKTDEKTDKTFAFAYST